MFISKYSICRRQHIWKLNPPSVLKTHSPAWSYWRRASPAQITSVSSTIQSTIQFSNQFRNRSVFRLLQDPEERRGWISWGDYESDWLSTGEPGWKIRGWKWRSPRFPDDYELDKLPRSTSDEYVCKVLRCERG